MRIFTFKTLHEMRVILVRQWMRWSRHTRMAVESTRLMPEHLP